MPFLYPPHTSGYRLCCRFSRHCSQGESGRVRPSGWRFERMFFPLLDKDESSRFYRCSISFLALSGMIPVGCFLFSSPLPSRIRSQAHGRLNQRNWPCTLLNRPQHVVMWPWKRKSTLFAALIILVLFRNLMSGVALEMLSCQYDKTWVASWIMPLQYLPHLRFNG